MRVAAYHLPQEISGFPVKTLTFGEVSLEIPVVTPKFLGAVIDHLAEARERLLKRTDEEILRSLVEVFTSWRDTRDPCRQMAEEALPAVTRFSPAMIAHGLDLLFQGYQPDSLERLIRGTPLKEFLNDFSPYGSGMSRAFGPSLTTHILAGNIPGIGLPGVVLTTILRSANVIKTSSGDPVFPALWAQSVARHDLEFGEALAVLPWRGGEVDLEEVAFTRADVVIAYGADATIRSIQGRVRGRFLGHGHRLSFGCVGREVLTQAGAVAKQAAYDASLFDQHGCLSPHCFYVEEGGEVTPREFSGLLAAAMEAWARELPPGPPTIEEAAAVQTFRAQYEARELGGKEVNLFSSPRGVEWAVIYDADPTFTPSCLHRTVLVKPVADLAELPPLLQSWRPYLQAIGIAVSEERLAKLGPLLGRTGVSRICPLGKMQAPPLTWHQEGREVLQSLLRWVDLEG